MNLRTDTEILAAALTETCVDVYVEKSREVSGIIARFTPLSICVKDASNPSESRYGQTRRKQTLAVENDAHRITRDVIKSEISVRLAEYISEVVARVNKAPSSR